MNWRNKLAILFTGSGLLLLMNSCSNLKYLPENEALYTGAEVKVEGVDKKKKRKELEEQLEAMVRPRPNSKILGMRVKLYAWNIAGNPKKKNSPAGLLKKFGEPPVLLSDFSLDHNILVLQSDLENRGYFRAEVTGDTTIRNQKAKAEFLASTGPRYTINEVFYQQDSSELQKAINQISRRRSLLKPGDPFDLEVIKAERSRIDAILKQRGFYFFNPDNILVDADTTIGENKVNLYVNTKPETSADARRRFPINDIYIYTDFNLATAGLDTHVNYATYYKGYYLIDRKNFYKPKLFEQAIQFNKGDIYNRRDHNNTLSRLINLGIFKFVQNRFVKDNNDTTLNAYYYITPMPRKSIRAEIGGHTKSNNLTGSQLTLGFTNRNTFKAGEILTINGTGGFEVQYSGNNSGFNTYRIGAEANLAFPRFITPFFKINTRGGFVPRTNFQLGYDILNRQKLYTLNSFRGGMGYIWKESIQKEHQFYPISIQYVQPIKVTQLYLDSLVKDVNLQKAIDTQFILGANYNYNYNQLAGRSPRNAIYFNGLIDVSGNIAGLVMGADAKASDPSRIFGAPFSQYTKLETDFRFYKKLGDRNSPNVWASRLILGAGFPYGNSVELPFIKQFFIGGNNSLRGFRSRTLGPGTYLSPGYGSSNFIADQSGDMKLEINTELRMKLFSIVHGALFVDAGNIWLKNENPNKPGSQFSKDFLKELAANAGVGIRFDVSILVLRLDVAFPIRKPYLPEAERWVIDDINFGDPDWRKENIIFNLGIGYPF